MNKIILTFLVSTLLLAACQPSDKERMGWVPIYAPKTDYEIKNIASLPSMENPGKIYIRGNHFYQIETGKGVHVIDVSDKASPKQIAFIQVTGVQEISIKDQYLYVNSYNDLVMIDITDIHAVKEAKRVPNTFQIFNLQNPPQPGYFECVDTTKGIVIGWKETMITNPKCRK